MGTGATAVTTVVTLAGSTDQRPGATGTQQQPLLELVALLNSSEEICAAVCDALPWPTLRRCRGVCKEMALLVCDALAQRPQITVVGGIARNLPIATGAMFDLPTASWLPLPPMSVARANAAVCALPDGTTPRASSHRS